MKSNKNVYSSRRQKFLAVFALVGLFACGLMIGLAFAKTKYIEKNTESVPEQAEVKTQSDNALPEKTCSAVEKLIEAQLYTETDMTGCQEFIVNHKLYQELMSKGCPENQTKYTELKNRSLALAKATCNRFALMDAGLVEKNTDTSSTCGKIESEMMNKVCVNCDGTQRHIDNAKIYAILAERGCAENSQKYTELAKQELEIARAIEDDKFDNQETIEVVETYKKLQMQAAAEEIFDKAKKITNPAIDFIMEVEKIINE